MLVKRMRVILSLYVRFLSCYEFVLCRLADNAVCRDSPWKQIGEKKLQDYYK